jgi:hypothetical protein
MESRTPTLTSPANSRFASEPVLTKPEAHQRAWSISAGLIDISGPDEHDGGRGNGAAELPRVSGYAPRPWLLPPDSTTEVGVLWIAGMLPSRPAW